MNKKLLAITLTAFTIGVMATALFFMSFSRVLDVHGTVGFSFSQYSIHTQITIYKGSELVLDENHAGVVTNLGDNMTHYKLWADSDMQFGSLNSSAYTPFISIGNYTGGNLNATSTVLPEEWHRELATIDGEQQSQLNFSCQITGGEITGTQVADCIGICLTETDDANDLWAYDVFDEVTGIDNTFTINIDIQVSVSHS